MRSRFTLSTWQSSASGMKRFLPSIQTWQVTLREKPGKKRKEAPHAVVRFGLVPKGYPISFEEPYQNEIQIGNFSDSYNVDVSDALRQMDVDVDFINGFNNSSEQEEYQSIRNALGNLHRLEEFYKNKEQNEDYKQIINALGVFKDIVFLNRA